MPIFQFKCRDCSSLFEHFVPVSSDGKHSEVSCLSCGSKKFDRAEDNPFDGPQKCRDTRNSDDCCCDNCSY
ncbi:MAG: FmdB family zinc ribbon protein [Candidatus Gracilibacteria bacterium]